MFKPWPLGISFNVGYYWVKRENTDSYKYQNFYAATAQGSSPDTMMTGFNVKNGTLKSEKVQSIHADLTCNKDGEERLLICCYYRPQNFDKSKLGLFILNPNFSKYDFVYKLVITPKPELFPIRK